MIPGLLGQGLALGIGLVGALVASRAGMPLPWMLGSMIATTIAALLRAPIKAPIRLRLIMVPILGVMLGSGFSPEIFGHLGDWIITFLVLPVFIASAFGAAFFFYRTVGKYDPVTAFYSSAPGGLNDMMMLGAAAGGDEKRIALAHASRILLVVCFVAVFFALVFDVTATGAARPYVLLTDVPLRDLGILGACAIFGALLGPKVGLPAPQILGPMILSGAVHLLGITDSPPPSLAVNTAQLVMGSAVGCRFAGATLREVSRDMLLAAGASSAMIIVALTSALIIAQLAGTELSQGFLALSPGGLPEMSLLALTMNADVAYVATSHIVRLAIVISITPLVFKLLGVGKRT